MMDRRRFRIVYLLALVLLLSADAAAQRVSATDETNRMVRAFADRMEIYLRKGLVFEHHFSLPFRIIERVARLFIVF